jgi:hypothetical protein
VHKNEKVAWKRKAWAGNPPNSPPKFEAVLRNNICCVLLRIDRYLRIMLSCPFIPTVKSIYSHEIEAKG